VNGGGRTSVGGGAGNAGLPGAGGTTVTGKSEGGVPDPDSGGGGNVIDGSTGDSAVEAGIVCGVGLTPCSHACVDMLTDRNHCGTCGTVCTGTDVCTKNGCAPPCANGLTLCQPTGTTTSVCVDTTLDENNCGGCNRLCAGGFVCESGTCVIDCGALTRCGTQCSDTTTDDVHCGNCSMNCKTSGQVCSAGVCQANCGFPFIACGSTCVNPQTDSQNCNGCGKPCSVGQACIGGTCTKLVENCQNGSDDDQDGLVDCLDPDCTTGFTCATTPAGWTGPIAFWSGATGAAPSCAASGGYPSALLTASSGLVVPPYTCPTCSCAVAAGTYCDDLSFRIYNAASSPCTGLPWTDVTVPANGACQDWALGGAMGISANSAKLQNAPGSYVHGSCTPSQQSPRFPAAGWGTEVRGCAASASQGGGCSAGQCLPKPVAPYGARLCVFRSGISSCPPDYPVQTPGAGQQYYQSILEGRSCSGCSCSTSCGGSVKAFAGIGCTGTGSPVTTTDSVTCSPIPKDSNPGGTDHHSLQWTNVGPVCGALPSALSGAPAPDSPITVCCQGP
jgi:hypothetical protein